MQSRAFTRLLLVKPCVSESVFSLDGGAPLRQFHLADCVKATSDETRWLGSGNARLGWRCLGPAEGWLNSQLASIRHLRHAGRARCRKDIFPDQGQDVDADAIVCLASVERRYEEDVVSRLNLIGLFTFQLPVCVVDEDQDSRSSSSC